MNRKPGVRLVKKERRLNRGRKAEVKPPVGPDNWSTAVGGWVNEFQDRQQTEKLQAFDSLFKPPPLPSGRED